MAYSNEFVTVDSEKVSDEVRKLVKNSAKDITAAAIDAAVESLRDTLEAKLRGMADYVVDAVQEHAEGEDLSLRRVVAAIENNSWDLDDLGIEVDVSEIEVEKIVYAHRVTNLIKGCVEEDGVTSVLEEVMTNHADADDTLNAMRNTFTAQGVLSALLGDHTRNGEESVLSGASAEQIADLRLALTAISGEQVTTPAETDEKKLSDYREAIREEVRREVEAEVQARMVACLFGKVEG